MINTIDGYIVALCPEFLGSLHRDTSKAIIRSNETVSYRGIDRDPWWNLDELFYEGLLDAGQMSLRRTIELSGTPCFSPGVCGDIVTAKQIQALSVTRPLKDEIIRVANRSVVANESSYFFGYDCYVDGFGSPLRLGIFDLTTAFVDCEDKLNGYGLFSSLDDLRDYVRIYCDRCEEAGVEVIEPRRISDSCFFQVWGVASD